MIDASEIIRVSRIASGAARRLEAGPRLVGHVHSVFERAVNVLGGDGRLLTLHGPGLLAAPFAAALDRFSRHWALGAGMPVHRIGEVLVVGSLRLECRGAEIVDTSLRAGSRIERILSTVTPAGPAELSDTGGDPDALAVALRSTLPAGAPTLASLRAREAERRLAQGLRDQDAARFIGGALDLIGLGEGLTPAGDDLLVGVLAITWRFRPRFLIDNADIARAIAGAARDRTTLVAREFLRHAVDGSFSETVIALVRAPEASAAHRALALLIAMGATSGADTAAGMLLASTALTERAGDVATTDACGTASPRADEVPSGARAVGR